MKKNLTFTMVLLSTMLLVACGGKSSTPIVPSYPTSMPPTTSIPGSSSIPSTSMSGTEVPSITSSSSESSITSESSELDETSEEPSSSSSSSEVILNEWNTQVQEIMQRKFGCVLPYWEFDPNTSNWFYDAETDLLTFQILDASQNDFDYISSMILQDSRFYDVSPMYSIDKSNNEIKSYNVHECAFKCGQNDTQIVRLGISFGELSYDYPGDELLLVPYGKIAKRLVGSDVMNEGFQKVFPGAIAKLPGGVSCSSYSDIVTRPEQLNFITTFMGSDVYHFNRSIKGFEAAGWKLEYPYGQDLPFINLTQNDGVYEFSGTYSFAKYGPGVIFLEITGKKIASNTHKLTIWAPNDEEQIIRMIADSYNQVNPKNKIEIKFVPVQPADTANEILRDPTSSYAADLFYASDDGILSLQKGNVIKELPSEYLNDVINNTSIGSFESFSLNDKLLAYPVTNDNGYFTWYDSSIYAPEDLTSFENILAKAHANGKQFLLDITNSWYLPTFLGSPDACGLTSMYYQTDENGKTSYVTNWDSDTGATVCEYVGGLIKKYVDNGTFINGSNDTIAYGFKEGTLAGAISGTWMLREFERNGIDTTRIRGAKLPSYHIDGKAYQMASFTGGKAYCVNTLKDASTQEAANKFAYLLTSYEAQVMRFKMNGTLPSNIKAMNDKNVVDNLSSGAKALMDTVSVAGITQSKAAENRYWNTVIPIGQAYMDGNLGKAANWKEFLNMIIEPLRSKL